MLLPGGGRHAPILIATSYQALNRALSEGPATQLCNCTVVILFAGFYLEAQLNHIAEELRLTPSVEKFSGKKYPGLQHKLAWFYNEFVARRKRKGFNPGMIKTLRRRFPGFAKLHRFRNDLSHGVVNNSARSLSETRRLRQQAKDIVSELFAILEKHGHSVSKGTTYYEAIARTGSSRKRSAAPTPLAGTGPAA